VYTIILICICAEADIITLQSLLPVWNQAGAVTEYM